MPKVKRSKKPPPDGWELIEPTLDELEQKMREGIYYYLCQSINHLGNLRILIIVLKIAAETDPHEGKRKVEGLWPIFKIHHQRSRYIFDLYHKRKAISKGKVSFYFKTLKKFYVLNIFLCRTI